VMSILITTLILATGLQPRAIGREPAIFFAGHCFQPSSNELALNTPLQANKRLPARRIALPAPHCAITRRSSNVQVG
jgi:hypothetical protein